MLRKNRKFISGTSSFIIKNLYLVYFCVMSVEMESIEIFFNQKILDFQFAKVTSQINVAKQFHYA